MVHPGTYAESGLTVAAGVRLELCRLERHQNHRRSCDGTRVTLAGDGSSIEDSASQFRPMRPMNPEHHRRWRGGLCVLCTFDGQAGSVGYGIGQTGAGKTISLSCDLPAARRPGWPFAVPVSWPRSLNHIPGGSTLAAAWDVTGGRFQGLDLNVGSPTVTDALRQSGGVVRVFTANWFNITNAIHFTGNAVDCSVQNGELTM